LIGGVKDIEERSPSGFEIDKRNILLDDQVPGEFAVGQTQCQSHAEIKVAVVAEA
jgi:hypothetical protein